MTTTYIQTKPVVYQVANTCSHCGQKVKQAELKDFPNLSSLSMWILDYIRWYHDEYKISPSIQEIASVMEKSKSVIDYHLDELAEQGAIKRIRKVSRGIVLL